MIINAGLLFAAAVVTIDMEEGEAFSIPDHLLSKQKTSRGHIQHMQVVLVGKMIVKLKGHYMIMKIKNT